MLRVPPPISMPSALAPEQPRPSVGKRQLQQVDGFEPDATYRAKRARIAHAAPPLRAPLPLAIKRATALMAQAAELERKVPTLRFDGSVPPTYRELFQRMVRHAPWFPGAVEIRVSAPDEEGLLGSTSTNPPTATRPNWQTTINVGLDKRGLSDADAMAGHCYTFVHELLDHALRHSESLAKSWTPVPESVDHLKLFWPANEGNAYHEAIKTILPDVPKPLRREFLRAYATDVNTHCVFDFAGHPDDPDGERFARRDHAMLKAGQEWAATLCRMADNPAHPFWRPAGMALGGNPMAQTVEDTMEAIVVGQIQNQTGHRTTR